MSLFMPLLLTLCRGALAGGSSADIELIPLTFSPGDLPGVDSPTVEGWGALRAGLVYHYAAEPLVLYDWYGERIGAAIAARATTSLGLSADLSPRVSVRLSLPIAMQDGADITGVQAEGVGTGDGRVGVRYTPVQRERITLGLSADLAMPTGTNEAWLGEEAPRLDLGAHARVRLGPVDLLTDASWRKRQPLDTELSLSFEDEVAGGFGVRLNLLPRWLNPFLSAVGRHGLGGSWSTSATNPVEVLAGVQAQPLPWLRLEVFGGQGLNDGYGAPLWRVGGGLRLSTPSKPPPERRAPEVKVTELPPEDQPGVTVTALTEAPEPEAEPWAPGVLARLEQTQITIRDPIQFEFGTDRILPESLPTLTAVAEIMGEHVELGQVVIEGHASEEGSFAYNYDLAFRRSAAIFQELVRAGVHPYRLSVRSMGEVVPKTTGADEASLASNRRVEFHIVHVYGPADEVPELGADIHLPWSGDAATVHPSGRAPLAAPQPPAPPPDPDTVDPSGFQTDESEEPTP